MMRRRFLIGVSHLLRATHLVFGCNTLLDLDVHTIAKSGGDGTAVVGLLLSLTFYYIYKGGIATKLDGTLGN